MKRGARVYTEKLKVHWGGWLGVTGHRMLSRHNGSQHTNARVQKHAMRRFYKKEEQWGVEVRAISPSTVGP